MKPQISSLTATRGFAAVLVYIFHFGKWIFPFNLAPSIFLSGDIAVSYFYVLSGFVLYISYFQSDVRYIDFIKKRLGRILPAYILALVLFALVYLFKFKMAFNAEFITQVAYSAFLIQAYFPKYALVLNTAGWSVSVEVFFYLLFPLLLQLQKQRIKLFAGITIAAFIATQIIYHLFFKNDPSFEENKAFFNFNPLMHINQFIIGMMGGYLYKQKNLVKKGYSALPIILFVMVLLAISFRPATVFYDAGLYAPLFMLFIISISVNNPRFLNYRPLVFLGEISYGIYILQFPVHEIFCSINNAFLHVSPKYFFIISLLVLCAAATVSYYALELPFRNLISQSSRKKNQI